MHQHVCLVPSAGCLLLLLLLYSWWLKDCYWDCNSLTGNTKIIHDINIGLITKLIWFDAFSYDHNEVKHDLGLSV